MSPQCRTPGGCSSGVGSANTGTLWPAAGSAGTTGSTSRVPAGPSCTVAVAGCGVGQIIGHIALDSASRIRWPRGNTHEVTCSSSGSAPGPPGVGGASAADRAPAADDAPAADTSAADDAPAAGGAAAGRAGGAVAG